MALFKYLLLPFAGLYNLVTRIRNHLYDIGHKKSFEFNTIVISVGNLNVGGSGKTPMIEYLIHLLSPNYRVATLSRGYGRVTSGFHIANEHDNARTIGDEPFQLYRKFKDAVVVTVGEERALAIPTILNERPEIQVILLDDAFQHRTVIPQFSVLVTDSAKPFYQDFVLPMGRLREARRGASRADVIVVTKCTNLSAEKESEIRKNLAAVVGNKPVFFTRLRYEAPVPINHQEKISTEVILVTGIANSINLEQEVAARFKVVKHFRYPDHHVYSTQEIDAIHRIAEANHIRSIITTEKDMVKLVTGMVRDRLAAQNWFYIPIQTTFVKDGSDFDNRVLRLVNSKLEEGSQGSE